MKRPRWAVWSGGRLWALAHTRREANRITVPDPCQCIVKKLPPRPCGGCWNCGASSVGAFPDSGGWPVNHCERAECRREARFHARCERRAIRADLRRQNGRERNRARRQSRRLARALVVWAVVESLAAPRP